MENDGLIMNQSTEDTHDLAFGIRLKGIRNNLGLNQGQFADMTGISRQSICYYECGKCSPSIDGLRLIAKALGCSTDYLLGLSESFEDTMEFAPPLSNHINYTVGEVLKIHAGLMCDINQCTGALKSYSHPIQMDRKKWAEDIQKDNRKIVQSIWKLYCELDDRRNALENALTTLDKSDWGNQYLEMFK